ncbi:hypothetical protein KH5H1_71420 [Corallococcus caeni]|uniref:hypothetical protein n=1 Tax=Corallococcus caeni TaxID=3082388 RepID=UPI002957CEB4|nr:hypothetical protein KH5H1_71420 [Corallococcus sp. KH5-1]
MAPALKLLLPLLTAQIEGLPGQDSGPDYDRPVSSITTGYIELLEKNSHIVYPVIAVVTLLLIGWGILSAWRTQDMDGLQKNEFKRAIINELRSNISGMPGDLLGRTIGLDRLKTNRLLEEMQTEGLVLSHTNSERLTVWRVRGAGPEARPRRY